jgi:hypothetical protein
MLAVRPARPDDAPCAGVSCLWIWERWGKGGEKGGADAMDELMRRPWALWETVWTDSRRDPGDAEWASDARHDIRDDDGARGEWQQVLTRLGFPSHGSVKRITASTAAREGITWNCSSVFRIKVIFIVPRHQGASE